MNVFDTNSSHDAVVGTRYSNRSVTQVIFLIICVSVWGCGQSRPVATVTDTVGNIRIDESTQFLLSSELVESRDSSAVVKCPITFTNLSETDQQVTLLSTGCSCYGVELQGRALSRGEHFTIPPNGTQLLEFRSVAPASQATKDYTARFSVPTEQGEQEFQATCTLAVYSDLSLTPRVLTAEAEWGQAAPQTLSLTIHRVLRQVGSEVVKSPPPDFAQLPTGVQVLNVQPRPEAEQLSEGLVRLSWTADVQVEVPADAASDARPQAFTVRFPDNPSANTEQTTTTGQIIVRTRSPIAFPQAVHFGKVSLGATRERRILIASPEQISFLLMNKKVTAPTISVEESEISSPRHWLNISITPEATGEFNESVTFETGLREFPEVTIRLQAIVE